jgi:hypothetical protein
MLNNQSTKLDIVHRLSEENLLFQSVLDISDEAIFIINISDFSIIDCNKSALRLFEASTKKQLISLPIFRLYNFEPMEISMDRVYKELKDKGEYSQELSFRTCKQNVFWGKLIQKNTSFTNVNYSILKITKSVNYLRDEEWLGEILKATSKVTGRQFFKELTKLLCRSFNASSAFIARRVADDTGRLKIFYWNGTKIKRNYIPIQNSFIENTLKGYTSYYPEGLRNLFPADEILKETNADSFIGSPIFDQGGEAFGLIGVLHTEKMEEMPNSRYMLNILSSRTASEIQRIRSKELLRQQTSELADINLMKDKLLSVISNDLQAPLNTILGYSGMLRNTSSNYSIEALSGKIKVMDNTLRNLYAFLENISDWNRLQQGEVRYSLNSNNLGNIIEATKPYYGYLLDLKSISLQNKVPSVLNIQTDNYLLRAIVRNVATYLIKNTMKSSSVIFDTVLRDGVWYLIIKTCHFTGDINDVKFCLESSMRELYKSSKDSSVPVLGLFIAREFMRLLKGDFSINYDSVNLEFLIGLKKN